LGIVIAADLFPFINLENLIATLVQNWSRTSLVSKIKDLAERRKLEDLTIGPVLTVSMGCCYFNYIILYNQHNTTHGSSNF
jgi:hypothetical protein